MPPIDGSRLRYRRSSGLRPAESMHIPLGYGPADPTHDGHDQQHPEDQQTDGFNQDQTAAIQMIGWKVMTINSKSL